MTRTIRTLLLASALALPAAAVKPVAEQVRHELAMLPYYNVFDLLQFRVLADGTVTLHGSVTRPVLRSDAENAVKRVPGVARVNNEIEVLPLSRFDDSIRLATFRAVYSTPGLFRLANMAQPPVHIIVKNGNVTLEGIAPNAMDRQIAYVRASSVPGVFSVTNNLAVENESRGGVTAK